MFIPGYITDISDLTWLKPISLLFPQNIAFPSPVFLILVYNVTIHPVSQAKGPRSILI